VLPDAGQHQFLHETPQAVFTVNHDGVTTEVEWRHDAPAPIQLATVAVLDTKCARAYADQEGELIFAPWGLDVVESLARNVFPKLEEGLRTELSALAESDAAFADLKGAKTWVAGFLGRLNQATSDEEVQQALSFTEEAAARLNVLATTLAEKSPAERARTLRAQASRLRTLVEDLEAAYSAIDDNEIARLATMDREVSLTVQAEQAAAARLRGDGRLLTGTGEAAWEALYSAAQAFIRDHGHSTGQGAPCPLCQTPFDAEASARMSRFAAYVTEDASSRARQQRAVHMREVADLCERDCNPKLDVTTVEFLQGADETWPTRLAEFVQQLSARQAWALRAALETHDWSNPPTMNSGLLDLPRAQAVEIESQAKALDAAQDAKSRAALAAEYGELHAREQLLQRKDALLELVNAKRKAKRLNDCLQQVKTKPISDKAGALASGAVTDQLAETLNEEFKRLGVSYLHTTLKARNDKGKTKVKLALDLPGFQKPEQILSEGEQRVIAIAAFFAELGVSHHKGAAVFDDPVSSLDHRRRQHVARRLVDEAFQRQVIVFTHDTAFLAELMTAIEIADAPHLFQHLTYSQQVAGLVNDGLPWRHRKTTERIDALEKLVRRFEAEERGMTNDQAEADCRSIYGKLREVIERGVEEVVFAGVVQRYNDYVRVPNIVETVGLLDVECEPLVRLYKRAGDVMEGHDKAAARAFAAPTAADAAADVAALRAALETIRRRRKPAKAAGGT
jgi:energy-coupling factor transporter ATP-binding protein EcfA2